MNQDIKMRTFRYAIRIVRMVRDMPQERAGFVLGKQLLRAGTSVGANVEEAVASWSRTDFAYKMSLALKEARESEYWLKLVEATALAEPTAARELLEETREIKNVLGAIVSRVRNTSKSRRTK